MSSIDLGNPQVLANLIKAKIKEGKGEIFTKEKVLTYKDEGGNEYVVPQELVEEVQAKEDKKEEAKKKKEAKKEVKKGETKVEKK